MAGRDTVGTVFTKSGILSRTLMRAGSLMRLWDRSRTLMDGQCDSSSMSHTFSSVLWEICSVDSSLKQAEKPKVNLWVTLTYIKEQRTKNTLLCYYVHFCVLTYVLNDLDIIVRDIQCAKLAEWFQVFQSMNEVLMEKQTAKLCLILQILNLPNAITFQP